MDKTSRNSVLAGGMKLESVLQYLDEVLGLDDHPDYPTALNGLQVAGPEGLEVRRIAAAVDASEAVIKDAVAHDIDLLVVHHGLFWGGLRPITGRLHRKLDLLLKSGMAVYSAHLPLDSHPAFGNCALLARAIGVPTTDRFGAFKGLDLGWAGTLREPVSAEQLGEQTARAVEGPVRVLGSGPTLVRRVAVITGSGGGFLEEAASAGIDALVTGEAAHHSFTDAHELGVHLVLAGHYATETFGVKALCAQLADRFDLGWEFLDHPSGL